MGDNDITIPPIPGQKSVRTLPCHALRGKFDPKIAALSGAAVVLHVGQVAAIFFEPLRIPMAGLAFARICGLDPLSKLKEHREKQTREILKFIRLKYPPHYIELYKPVPADLLDDPARVRLSLLSDDMIRDPDLLPVSHRAEALKTQIISGLQALGWKAGQIEDGYKDSEKNKWGFTFFLYDDDFLHTEAGLRLLWEERGTLDRLVSGDIEQEGGLLREVTDKIRENAPGWLFSGARKAGEHLAKRFATKLPSAMQGAAPHAFPALDALLDTRTLALEIAVRGTPFTENEFVERLLKPLAEARHETELAGWRLCGERGLKPKLQKPDVHLIIEHRPVKTETRALTPHSTP